MLGRLSAALSVLRPRTLARTIKSVEILTSSSKDLNAGIKRLSEHGQTADARLAALEDTMKGLEHALADLKVREARLRATYQRDIETEGSLATLGTVLDEPTLREHVTRAVERSTLHHEPFPHLVVEHLFPEPFYRAVLDGIPPVELFDGGANKQRMVVPFEMAPAFSRRVWGFLLETVVDGIMGPAVTRKFSAPLGQWLGGIWPDIQRDLEESRIRLQSTDGRILLRRRGYTIPPHRDPKWGFVTCLLYLAKPGDSPAWGTQLYEVAGDREATSIAPHWIRAEQCRLVKDVPFRANSALVFMNSHGAHGASIPADAEPADLERYIYQFRIGPSGESIRRLLERLPAEERQKWQGKAVDYV